ncbi:MULTISPECIES: EAL domain-containing protein [unclassified Pseudomonas]|uniref:EAL domain-containing response regulator n=1 Tax=unclassified Pseudomonas TaxID=196821 RepID=UPI002447A96A|nr:MULTISPECIES: EAL domain-containing protein [unclassified Pseudomonas]MDH0305069.1 EAL domain-containing protein [Pseudomonas sp. GD04091]MDH1987035.1 EAL domain-containing protein [Pseudomonas sp. GD03689]
MRVLVLEDHGFQRTMAVRGFVTLGCGQVLEAACASEALALLQHVGAVDLVVCDLRERGSDGMDGLEFIHRAGLAGLARAVLISDELPADLRRSVRQVIERLGMGFIGDLAKPLLAEPLERILAQGTTDSLLSGHAPQPQPARADVLGALRDEAFLTRYLPSFDLRSNKVESVHVVAAWQHPRFGRVGPETFMSMVEHVGLHDELLLMLLRQALVFVRTSGEPNLRLILRLTADQLASNRLFARLLELLHDFPSRPHSLCFELSGRGLYRLPVQGLENLLRLNMLGCELGLAEFGSDQAGSSLLCELPITRLRLSARLAQGLPEQARCRSVIQHCQNLARALQVTMAVSGVGTARQCLALQRLGCEIAQGDYFTGPVEGSALLRRLRQEQQAPA